MNFEEIEINITVIFVSIYTLLQNDLHLEKSVKPFTTESGSTEALLQILHSQYLILGVSGSCMF
jgi:hypothetical protein